MAKAATDGAAVAAPVSGGGVDMEQVMQELGQFRRYHLGNYCLLALVGYFAAHHALNYVFLAADVDYRYTYSLPARNKSITPTEIINGK